MFDIIHLSREAKSRLYSDNDARLLLKEKCWGFSTDEHEVLLRNTKHIATASQLTNSMEQSPSEVNCC